MVPVSPSLCKNILVFIYAKARILITICLLNACTILKNGLSLADTQQRLYMYFSSKGYPGELECAMQTESEPGYPLD